MPLTTRNSGLDILRSAAIILVFMQHFSIFTGTQLFGVLSNEGWMGVDLFFALSGYLIGNQIFSAISNQGNFSLKIFYARRFYRTLPNYFVVLALYYLIPAFREQPLVTPLWKFLSFTQNFNLIEGAFAHAWSLCIEEQFYLIFPLVALWLVYKRSLRYLWYGIISVLLLEILIRSISWVMFMEHAPLSQVTAVYASKLYYPSYVRLDSLVLGVAVALLKNFHPQRWSRLLLKGNLWLVLGILGFCVKTYLLQNDNDLIPVMFGYLLLGLSSSALIISALSPHSWIYQIRIPGAEKLATWSYAIYLTHRQLIHLTNSFFSERGFAGSPFVLTLACIFVTLAGGWLLYTCIEKPFLNRRDKLGKIAVAQVA